MVASNNAIYNTVGASISGVTNTLTVTNPSNTASSAARETIVVGGGTAGDPTLNWNVSGVTNWEMGIDNSDSDKFKLSQGTALGTNDTFIMTTAGIRTMPLQPCFSAYLGTQANNVTGDGTSYYLGDTSVGVALTETLDAGANFTPGAAGGAVFTAPVTGNYFFTFSAHATGMVAAHNQGSWRLELTGITYSLTSNNPFAMANLGAGTNVCNTLLVRMSSGDTAKALVLVGGGAKTVNIAGTIGARPQTVFCGYLIS